MSKKSPDPDSDSSGHKTALQLMVEQSGWEVIDSRSLDGVTGLLATKGMHATFVPMRREKPQPPAPEPESSSGEE